MVGFMGASPHKIYFFAIRRHSTVKLLPANARRKMKSILVPVDFSDVTVKVVKAAVYLAKAFQSHITLIHVDWTEPAPEIIDFGAGPNLVPPPVVDEMDMIEVKKKKLAELEKLVTSVGLTATTVQLQGPPVADILAHAENPLVDLIVIVSHHAGEY